MVQTEKVFIEVDGHQLGMFIETVNEDHPVLLFLHGGPGFPQYPMIKKSELRLEAEFTVCYWDQRGAGMSYNARTQGELTLDKAIKDTLEVTQFLKERFRKEKIYLFGHSWGALLGSVVASRFGEHYAAYIGSGQFGRHNQSNEETYQFLLHTAIEKGDQKAEKDIRAYTFDENFYQSQTYRKILSKYLTKYGGGMKRESYTQWDGLKEWFTCKEYTWGERFNLPKGVFASYDALSETMAKADATLLAPNFQMPVYIFQGKYDYQTSYNEAKRFFELIKAPHKQFYSFDNCAHSPFLEEASRFLSILKEEVLRTPIEKGTGKV
ncbi:alpha/beta fold hydrolase [Halalkalibacter sp. AB-rgal2]|uniref:alpha/beta fold hydrolase n=1 Tax=Halalkalibacter sp. AB-rgal2 TaxID=3242695 RepID=UPI00359EBFA0